VEWPPDEPAPTQYWLADLRGEPVGLRRLVRLAKGRWRIEQDYRELKDDLGLDHFEGRSYPSLTGPTNMLGESSVTTRSYGISPKEPCA